MWSRHHLCCAAGVVLYWTVVHCAGCAARLALVCQWLSAANGPQSEIWPINQYEYDERINECFPRISTERHHWKAGCDKKWTQNNWSSDKRWLITIPQLRYTFDNIHNNIQRRQCQCSVCVVPVVKSDLRLKSVLSRCRAWSWNTLAMVAMV